jgi:hypothetical protein
MNKALAQILFLVLMLASSLAFTLAFAPADAVSAHPSNGHRDHVAVVLASTRQPPTPRPTVTATPTPEPVSQPGSTDGLVIMSVAIVVIIALPILLQRGLWVK